MIRIESLYNLSSTKKCCYEREKYTHEVEITEIDYIIRQCTNSSDNMHWPSINKQTMNY